VPVPMAHVAVRDVLAFDVSKEKAMLYTIAVILLVMWLLGLVSGYTVGAFIHVLLVVAIVLFLVGLVSGRRTI
jgi:Family of unknown function (DUF5670)